MQERNVISGVGAMVLTPFVDGWEMIFSWLLLSLVLIVADLIFGIKAARKRGEIIRGSRAVRRTMNKMVDYICWVSIAWVLGGTFGKIFHIPLLAATVMLIICIVEMSSIFNNYFLYKGVSKKFNVIRFFSKLFKIDDLETSFEDIKEVEHKGGE